MGEIYVVFVGREPCVYDTWREASSKVNGHKGAIHRSFKNREEAERAYRAYLVKQSADNSFKYPGNKSSPTASSSRSRLMENYLAEIACDHNLSVPRFLNFAKCIPDRYRVTDDGMYRAIDIYLKAHPELSDTERKKIYSLMDCQKLSREACAHAAQNDMLLVQTVQVLYHEQQHLGEVVDGGLHESSPALDPPKTPETIKIHTIPDEDSISILQRENEDLKLELMKMKMRLKDMENSSVKISGDHANPSGISCTMSIAEKPIPSRKSSLSSVSRKLSRFIWPEGNTPGSKGRVKAGKDRRHSIS